MLWVVGVFAGEEVRGGGGGEKNATTKWWSENLLLMSMEVERRGRRVEAQECIRSMRVWLECRAEG